MLSVLLGLHAACDEGDRTQRLQGQQLADPERPVPATATGFGVDEGAPANASEAPAFPSCTLSDVPLPLEIAWIPGLVDGVGPSSLSFPEPTAAVVNPTDSAWAVQARARFYVEDQVFEIELGPVEIAGGLQGELAFDLSPWTDSLTDLRAPAHLKVIGTITDGNQTRAFTLPAINLHREAASDAVLVYSNATKAALFDGGDLQGAISDIPFDPDTPEDPPTLDDYGIGREFDPAKGDG